MVWFFLREQDGGCPLGDEHSSRFRFAKDWFLLRSILGATDGGTDIAEITLWRSLEVENKQPEKKWDNGGPHSPNQTTNNKNATFLQPEFVSYSHAGIRDFSRLKKSWYVWGLNTVLIWTQLLKYNQVIGTIVWSTMLTYFARYNRWFVFTYRLGPFRLE